MMGIIQRALVRVFGQKATASHPVVMERKNAAVGAWGEAINGFVPREVNPHLYESLREAIPVLDGAIQRLVTVDGILRVRGKNRALVETIKTELFEKIPVNDAEFGLQAFYALQGNELYEQGIGVGEMLLDKRGQLVGLRVADSKGIAFSRDANGRLRWWYKPPARKRGGRADGSDSVESILRNQHPANAHSFLSGEGYKELSPDRMIYTAMMPEADNPYGTSLLRSMEFVSQILLKIQTATGNTWDRFGDPSFSLIYKVKNRAVASDQKALDHRRDVLAANLKRVNEAKRSGNSADFVQAVALEDEINIGIIGAQDQILEIEMPAQHMLEQIVSKTGLPSWMLGFHWSTAERLAKYQSELVLQESRTRFERRLPGLRLIVETFLRGRGLTWNAGDWELYQELPNLQDEVQRAQAKFLEAQTALMLTGAGVPTGTQITNTDDGDTDPGELQAEKRVSFHPNGRMDFHFHSPSKQVKSTDDTPSGEAWAEDSEAFTRIERAATASLLKDWHALEADVLQALQLPTGKHAKTVAWEMKAEWLGELERLAAAFTAAQSRDDSALVSAMIEAWLRGMNNAATELGAETAITAVRDTVTAALRDRGMLMVRNVMARVLEDGIIKRLASGALNGESPFEVAKQLRKAFGMADYDWERLARTEIGMAQADAKQAQFQEMGVERYNYSTAGDDRVSETCQQLAAAGPYLMNNGPRPVRDSHPNCRCTITAVID